MRTLGTMAAMAFLASLSLAGGEGGSPFENVIKSMLGAMDKMTRVLGTIQDEDTAKAARPELTKIAQDWSALRKKAENVPPPTKEEKDRLAKQFKSKLEVAQKKLFAEIGRVQLLPGGKEALADLSKALSVTKNPSP